MISKNEEATTSPITSDQLVELLVEMAKSHGIEFVASPSSWSDIVHAESCQSISIPMGENLYHQDLMPMDTALTGGTQEFPGFLLYEVQVSLCDAGFDFAGAECPIFVSDVDSSLVVNRESKVPLSVFLLSADRTFESLSKLMAPDFFSGCAISTAWFARSVSTAKGQPQPTLNNTISLSMG